jgi:glutaminyl-peptide cyclotransferase
MAQAGVSISKWILALGCMCLLTECTDNHPGKQTEVPSGTPPVKLMTQAPDFNADSAYLFVKTQVDFGPRVPNTKAHERCAEWYGSKLKAYGMTVNVQEGSVKDYEGRVLKIKNIMGSFNPAAKVRIVLFSHWDSRRIADDDSVRTSEPIDGADDGGSGSGVMIEVARQLHKTSPSVGVDLMFLDAEDTGMPNKVSQENHQEDTWCLGTQYWTKNLPENYHPRFGILLDMVGAKNAQFPMEGNSMEYASDYVRKVWSVAGDIGYSNFFLYTEDGHITDDHVYINRDAKIPTIDIINYNSVSGGFGSYHHTHADNMDIIDRNTLKGVGQTLLQVIYSEMP